MFTHCILPGVSCHGSVCSPAVSDVMRTKTLGLLTRRRRLIDDVVRCTFCLFHSRMRPRNPNLFPAINIGKITYPRGGILHQEVNWSTA